MKLSFSLWVSLVVTLLIPSASFVEFSWQDSPVHPTRGISWGDEPEWEEEHPKFDDLDPLFPSSWHLHTIAYEESTDPYAKLDGQFFFFLFLDSLFLDFFVSF